MQKIFWRTSLVRISLIVGLLYGYIASLHNQNPYYPVARSRMPEETWAALMDSEQYAARAWNWQPSPVWLPSYLLCKCPGGPGIGIIHTKSGYIFRSSAGLYLYEFASTILGGLLGLMIGWTIFTLKSAKDRG